MRQSVKFLLASLQNRQAQSLMHRSFLHMTVQSHTVSMNGAAIERLPLSNPDLSTVMRTVSSEQQHLIQLNMACICNDPDKPQGVYNSHLLRQHRQQPITGEK